MGKKGATGSTLPEEGAYKGTGLNPKDVNEFNDRQRGNVGRNVMDISNPKNLTMPQVHTPGGNVGFYGHGGTEQEQEQQEKIANKRRDDAMKILKGYLGDSNSMREMQRQFQQAQIEHLKAQTSQANQRTESDRLKTEMLQNHPEVMDIIDQNRDARKVLSDPARTEKEYEKARRTLEENRKQLDWFTKNQGEQQVAKENKSLRTISEDEKPPRQDAKKMYDKAGNQDWYILQDGKYHIYKKPNSSNENKTLPDNNNAASNLDLNSASVAGTRG